MLRGPVSVTSLPGQPLLALDLMSSLYMGTAPSAGSGPWRALSNCPGGERKLLGSQSHLMSPVSLLSFATTKSLWKPQQDQRAPRGGQSTIHAQAWEEEQGPGSPCSLPFPGQSVWSAGQ